LSHLKALALYLEESPAGSAIIFEDDVLLHRNWHEQLTGVLDNLEEGAPLCSLGYEVVSWDGFSWAGRDPERQNLMLMNPVPLWGAHAYWTTREHAEEALSQYDLRIGEPRLLSEFIVKWPGAFVAVPPLAIEDGMPSTIRTEHEMGVHRMIHHGWGVQNYGSDPEDHLLKKRLSNQTICLCMIVRNEAHVIGRLAASLEGLIDSWVICDTGSTDGTPEMVSQVFADLPGRLYHDEWLDYGTNRSLLLERARGTADYLLILDADQTIRVTRQLRSLHGDAYSLLVDDPIAHWVPRLVRGDLPWRYVGAAHEYLTSDQPYRTENLFGLIVEHHADGGNRPDKMERELKLLEGDLAKDPDNPRTFFYLAQTHRELGHDDEAVELYSHRIQLGGWAEEVFYSMFRRAELVAQRDWDRGVALLLEAWAFRPSRVEPLYTLVQGLRARNQYRLAEMFAGRGMPVKMPTDILFVHREPYDWGLVHEWSEAAFWTGDIEAALSGYDYLLTTRSVPPEILERASERRQQSRVALGLEEGDEASDTPSLEELWLPRLTTLVEGATIGELQLSIGPSWSLSDPSICSDGDDFRMLVFASSHGDQGERTEELFLEVELAGDFAVRSVLAVDGEPVPAGAALDGPGRPRLVAFNGNWLVLSDTAEDDPSGGRVVLSALADGEFVGPRFLSAPDGDSHPTGWIPLVVDDELLLITSVAPTIVARCDPRSGSIDLVKSSPASDGFIEEWGATPAVRVPDGVLTVTRRVGTETRLSEHRFVLFGDDLVVHSASPRFCFQDARGETCTGLALRGGELVLSFGHNVGGTYLARVPYEKVRAILWPE
jgi:GR25 family glycosyltransferase involved in LPS biosynthesis